MSAVDDRGFMARAIVLAERGRATVRPNPAVGCVLVRDGVVVGEGWHEAPGGPHAEVAALRAAGDAARGATAYVSLEPCGHQGRTGPCAGALLAAGVARVVYAASDPAHGGAEALRGAGIEVVGGVLEDWAAVQNEDFLFARRAGRPFVTLKLAQTVDGHLTVRGRRWLTGERARTAVHRQRAGQDAVLVGSGTVVADDPRLDVRHVPVRGGQPRPVVLDARGRIAPHAAVVRPGGLVFTTETSDHGWRTAVADRGVEVIVVAAGPAGGVALTEVLAVLADREVNAVYVEGGATVAGAFVAQRLVDRLVLHVAVALAGPDGMPAIAPAAAPPPSAGWRWRTERTGYLGPDLEVVAVPQEVG